MTGHLPHRLAAVFLAAGVAVVAAGTSAGAPTATSAVAGSWVGTVTMGGTGSLALVVAGGRATVVLGVGRAGAQPAGLSQRSGVVRFRVAGRPQPILFTGRIAAGRLTGSVRSGALTGRFSLRRGDAGRLLARGLYGLGRGTVAVVEDPFGPQRLVDLGTGAVRAVTRSGASFSLGSGWAATTPSTGSASFDARGATLDGARLERVPTRSFEVRFRSGSALLAGTLTLPPGPGPHPAAVFVHGGGKTERAYLPDLHAMLLARGVGVLAYDKRGVGLSGGRYVFDFASESTIEALARDVAAAARFLAAQPEIDSTRVGVAGHSQAGWVMPRAATLTPAIRWLISFAGPTVTQGATDEFARRAGAGVSTPSRPRAAIEAEVDALAPTGVDPLPWIAALRIPGLWLFGGNDLVVPTGLCVRALLTLDAQPGRDIELTVFPRGNHALVETRTGLNAEMLASSTWATGLFDRVGSWLASRGVTDAQAAGGRRSG